jgi:hypothetical protein
LRKKERFIFIPSVDPLVLEGIAGLESFLIALSSMIGNGLLDDVN